MVKRFFSVLSRKDTLKKQDSAKNAKTMQNWKNMSAEYLSSGYPLPKQGATHSIRQYISFLD